MIKHHNRKKSPELIDTMMEIHRLENRLIYIQSRYKQVEHERKKTRDRLERLQPQLQSWLDELPKLREENIAFRSVLKEYADKNNWDYHTDQWLSAELGRETACDVLAKFAKVAK